MDELRRIILPSVQGKIYIFLRTAIRHWPLDSSSRLILEAWLSFIQPWRYVPGVTYLRDGKPTDDDERDKIHNVNRWIGFVANNLLAYTAIFQQLLPRFARTDLVAPKNALMLYRVTKVFSQPHLAKMIADVESCIGVCRGKISSNQWLSIVQQHILETEGRTYQYIPLFSNNVVSQVIWFLGMIKQAHSTATSLLDALEKKRRSKRLIVSIWEFFTGEETEDISLEDRQRVPTFLANAQQQLIDIFKINLEDIPRVTIDTDQEYHDSILSTSFCQHSQLDSTDSSKLSVQVLTQDRRSACKYVEYMGDPELQPVRSDEFGFLVRALHKLCCYLNQKYQDRIVRTYNREDFLGRIARQVLRQPITVVNLPKRSSNGITERREEHLPARISLRRLASRQFIAFVLFGVLTSSLFGYGSLSFLALVLGAWGMYILAKAICEPWSRSNVAFRPNSTDLSFD